MNTASSLYSPYDRTSIVDAVTPCIVGPSSFCNTAIYSIFNLPTGATVTWNVWYMNITSGQGTGSINPVGPDGMYGWDFTRSPNGFEVDFLMDKPGFYQNAWLINDKRFLHTCLHLPITLPRCEKHLHISATFRRSY